MNNHNKTRYHHMKYSSISLDAFKFSKTGKVDLLSIFYIMKLKLNGNLKHGFGFILWLTEYVNLSLFSWLWEWRWSWLRRRLSLSSRPRRGWSRRWSGPRSTSRGPYKHSGFERSGSNSEKFLERYKTIAEVSSLSYS